MGTVHKRGVGVREKKMTVKGKAGGGIQNM